MIEEYGRHLFPPPSPSSYRSFGFDLFFRLPMMKWDTQLCRCFLKLSTTHDVPRLLFKITAGWMKLLPMRERKKMQWRLKMCYQAVGFFQVTKYNCVGIVPRLPFFNLKRIVLGKISWNFTAYGKNYRIDATVIGLYISNYTFYRRLSRISFFLLYGGIKDMKENRSRNPSSSTAAGCAVRIDKPKMKWAHIVISYCWAWSDMFVHHHWNITKSVWVPIGITISE